MTRVVVGMRTLLRHDEISLMFDEDDVSYQRRIIDSRRGSANEMRLRCSESGKREVC